MTPEHQILSELEAAVEQAMVATRHQDRTPRSPKRSGTVAVVAVEKKVEAPKAISQKRRRISREADDVGQERAKRRRPSAARESLTQSSSSHRQHKVTEISNDSADGRHHYQTTAALPTNGTEHPHDGIEVRIVARTHTPQATSIETQTPTQLETHSHKNFHGPDGSDTSHRDIETQIEDTAPRKLRKPAGPGGADNHFKSTRSTHKKFDEDEPMTAALPAPSDISFDEAKQAAVLGEDDKAESDDEAPETLTASKGWDQVRHAGEEAETAAKRYLATDPSFCKVIILISSRQKAEEKRKRRERDQRLKIQAKNSKKISQNTSTDDKPKLETPISPDTLVGSVNVQGSPDQVDSKPTVKGPLSLLLPDELLNAEPIIRPPALPPNAPPSLSTVARRRKLLERDSKPPKDIQRGALKVRVLSSDQGYLPPKASKESKTLRESWLTGHRGPRGGIERRKIGGRFVRAGR